MSPEERHQLAQLQKWAYDVTMSLPPDTDAVELFRRGARAALVRYPDGDPSVDDDLGRAIAGVLAMAAYERELTGLRTMYGASSLMIALAATVGGVG